MLLDMGGFLDNLGQLVLTHQAWSHYLIAIGILLQGEITVLVSVYLVINGSLGFGDFIIPAFIGIMIGDYALYFMGRFFRGTRFGWRMYKKLKQNKNAQFYTYYVSQNLKKIIILSKFLIGANFLTLLAVGWTRVKIGKFFRSHILAVISWLSGVTIVSYFLAGGLYLLKAEKVFKQVEIGIVVGMAAIILAEYLLKKFLGKKVKFEPKNKELEKLMEEDFGEEEELEEKPKNNRVKSENAEDIFK